MPAFIPGEFRIKFIIPADIKSGLFLLAESAQMQKRVTGKESVPDTKRGRQINAKIKTPENIPGR